MQNLALFLAAFFRAHLGVLEGSEELRAALVAGLDTLVAISYVDDDEVGGRARLVWAKERGQPAAGGSRAPPAARAACRLDASEPTALARIQRTPLPQKVFRVRRQCRPPASHCRPLHPPLDRSSRSASSTGTSSCPTSTPPSAR